MKQLLGSSRPAAVRACCVWLTGLPASGKSTLARALADQLHEPCCILDGDVVRCGLNRDLGFSAEDRAESVRRVSEVARMLVESGITAIVAMVSPFDGDRRAARARFVTEHFVEIFIDTPLPICEQRDPKGLYGRARSGVLIDMTGISSPYERPESPELTITHDGTEPTVNARRVIDYLRSRGLARCGA